MDHEVAVWQVSKNRTTIQFLCCNLLPYPTSVARCIMLPTLCCSTIYTTLLRDLFFEPVKTDTRVTEIRDDSAAYLSDASGRSVTPIILTPQELAKQKADATAGGADDDMDDVVRTVMTAVAPAALKRGAERRLTSREALGLQSTGLDKNEREAAAELKKLKDQKRHEGVTMGLEGSRLANAKRRRGFLDDEDFEDFIEDSEPEF